MIKFKSYCDKIMIDFFESGLIYSMIALTATYVLPIPYGAVTGLATIIYLLYKIVKSIEKMSRPESYLKNCWWEPGKEG